MTKEGSWKTQVSALHRAVDTTAGTHLHTFMFFSYYGHDTFAYYIYLIVDCVPIRFSFKIS